MKRAVCLVSCLLALVHAARALAAPLSPADVARRLLQGRTLYAEQEYARAIPVMRSVVDAEIATSAQKITAFEVLGLSHLILGQEKQAREAFENLLALDAEHTLVEETQSPKILRFYERVKAAYTPGYRAGPNIKLEVAVPEKARGGRPLEFQVRVARGEKSITEVRLFYRSAGTLSYLSQGLTPQEVKGRFQGTIRPPAERTPWTLEYYVEAKDAAGSVRARFGEPLRPLSLPVAEAEPGGLGNEGAVAGDRKPLVRRWWFWTAIGAAVVGGVVLGLTLSHPQAPASGTLDTVKLHP